MNWIANNPIIFYLISGLVLLGADIFIIGLSPLMFVAVGALVTSGLLYLGGWHIGPLEALTLCAVISLLLALVGHKPLRSFQNANVQEDNSSDLVGRELVTTQEVTKVAGSVDWSGTQWQARLAATVPIDTVGPGVRMKVVQVNNLALVLSPVA
jgi:membrane protein implicated in regulation of membrane protease activity